MEINSLDHLTRIGGTSGSGADPNKPPMLNDIDLDVDGEAGKSAWHVTFAKSL